MNSKLSVHSSNFPFQFGNWNLGWESTNGKSLFLEKPDGLPNFWNILDGMILNFGIEKSLGHGSRYLWNLNESQLLNLSLFIYEMGLIFLF